MHIVFYCAPMSSATPVACTLGELEVPHERVVFELAQKRHKEPAFLALNPNGKVPTLVVDGTPMFESLAIMHWLGDRFGVARGLWPAAESPLRMRALSWTTWLYVSFGAAVARLNISQHPRFDAALHNPVLAAHSQKELAHQLELLEAELVRAPYMLGDDYSLVDGILTNMLLYAGYCGVSSDAHPQLRALRDRCAARPAIAREWAAQG